MRHAPQARFDRHVGLTFEQRVTAYTVEQMLHWTETDFNWHMRRALQSQGFRTFHIREASETGIADLIVYSEQGVGVDTPVARRQVVDAWIELKKDNNKAAYIMDPKRAAQRQFMREHWRIGHNAMFVMMDRKVGMLAVHQGDLCGRVKMYPLCPYNVKWAEVFAHFKARK